MSRLAFTWELGSGTGYSALIARIAQAAVEQGHECVFVVRDLHAAAAQLPSHLGLLVQAPVATPSKARPVRVQTSFATLLHNNGFGDPDALAARLRAWRDLYCALGVERLAARHSPTAVLAARTVRLPLLHYGAPFTIPPETTPWPSFRPDLSVTDEALLQNEAQVLRIVNAALSAFDSPPLARVRDLFGGLSTALLGYPELDPFAGARTHAFVGLPALGFGEVPEWPEGSEPKLFVSLLPDAHTRAWLDVLAELPARALVRFHGPVALLAHPSPRLRIATGPLNFNAAIEASSAVIGYGSHNLACAALQAGKPMALLAHTPDELMTAQGVQAAGCGIILPEQPDAGTRERLGRWLENPSCAVNAQRFAERYRTPARGQVATELLRRLLNADPQTQ